MQTVLEQKINSFNNFIKEKSIFNCITSNLSKEAKISLASFNDKQKAGRLYGKTIAIKENINVKGVPLQCGSSILEGYISPYNATVIKRIKENGGLILGMTNMDEFAMGSSTEYSVHGPTINSVGDNLVAGGSSGGSAVAVSSNMVDLALGSDTGGSVRQPASFCGVYGLKPTYGRISRYGLTAFASSFDQIGIFSKSVDDMTDLFFTIAGNDKHDATSSNTKIDNFSYNETDTRKLKIGLPYRLNDIKEIAPEILDCYNSMIDYLDSQGFDIINLDMENLKYSISVYYILTTAEASSNLSRFDGIRYGLSKRSEKTLDSIYLNTKTEGFGEEVKRRIILGTYVLSSGYYDQYYSKAQKIRKMIKVDFDKSFKEVDLLFLPTVPELPYKIGEKQGDPLSMYLADIFTVPPSL